MKVAVVGGCGFIGRRIVEAAKRRGLHPVSVDDLSYAPAPSPDPDVMLDITKVNEGHLQGSEIIVHAAALASVPYCEEDPAEAWHRNVASTAAAVKLARDCGHKKFVYVSSCAVYGDLPWDQTGQGVAVAPISVYGQTKYAGELVAANVCKQAGMSLSVFRLANVYGPGQALDRGGVVTLWMHKLAKSASLTLRGDGEQTRDFVYVDDVAEILAIDCGYDGGGTHTIATGTSVSMRQLAEMVWSLNRDDAPKITTAARPPEEIVFSEMPQFDFEFRDLLEGLEETWDGFAPPKGLESRQ